ncbi:MAG: type IX secretion system membrane protein PorP/SprF [Clostridium sp.]|nr:type IX secretion system membrane protein PorP/SprF [Prevotella sp.]MCM1429573.1 type IX secretion system membrane protein PorP/SprF [Clostridium sp.]MCM1476020.1 type IX secretion system membrane protein PorP/SprF [Muribaculaceae bacterium]
MTQHPNAYKYRLSLLLLLLSFIVTALRAQGDVQFTQYWAVPTYYNPAYTGSTDYLRIRGGARLQWLGIENAPKSFMGLADSPLKIGKKRIGVGLNLMQENLGLFSNLMVNIQASYKFKALKGEFSVGLQGGYYNSKFKGSEVYIPDGDDYHQGTDTSIPMQDVTGNSFDFSTGISYTHKYFSVGISGLHLLNPTVKLNTEGTETDSETAEFETELPRMLYFTADSNIPIKNTLFELQPSVIVSTDFNQVNGGVTMRARYNKFLSFGAGYRWDDAVSVMIGAEFKNFFIGYAYDYPVSAIAKGSSGSHELVAGYQLKLDFGGKNKNKHRSIRIM